SMEKTAPTLLLVEDEAIIAMAETKELSDRGFRVVHVPTGERAVETMRTGTLAIDLVLMDIDLGRGMDGTEAAREILKASEVPIVFLSSHTERSIVERTETIASYGYVLKSSGVTILTAAIRMAFQLHAAHQENKDKSRQLEHSNSRLCDTVEELQVASEELSTANDSLLAACADLQRSEESLKASERRYHSLFRNMLDGFAYCAIHRDSEGRPCDWTYLETNEAFERLTGLRDATGRRVSELIPGILEADPELFEIYGRVAATGAPERFEMEVCSLGQWFAVSVYSPEPGHFIAVFEVITKRKLTEQALERSLSEKEVILLELRHRVKNNLGIISGLLAMGASKAGDSEAGRLLEDARSRVDAMSGIYEALIQTDQIDLVEMPQYLGRLASSLYETSVIEKDRISISVDIDVCALELRRAVPLCLIVNELFSNALKYAYPAPRRGSIDLALRAQDGELSVTVSDRGVGLPQGLDPKTCASTGLSLVRMLAGQLGAALDFECVPGGGTRARVVLRA
ncbi:MAG TPA: histidine kinase dimerization/phosphoacceptor domain -containing protein, partial [Rectinemataceae bacterium]|nr:histidine kinase dimerization/phosphoacceptor domain -containing protein [Rectinemataceae bacterium]